MNYWTELSIQFASQRNYLDELFKVYPLAPDTIRDINQDRWNTIKTAFEQRDDIILLKNLLKLDLFPIKDSYVAYLKNDVSAVARNPETVSRLCGRLYDMGLDEIYKQSSLPKETNRQIGPLFKRWVQKKTLGLDFLTPLAFAATTENSILEGTDAELMQFARTHLAYDGTKGLDLVVRMRGKYVVGEEKFLTDFGGHQNAQFEDAKNLLKNSSIQ